MTGTPNSSRPWTKRIAMSNFRSQNDKIFFVQILKTINPITIRAYGPLLDEWLKVQGKSEKGMLINILKSINPVTVRAYGRLLDSWSKHPFNRHKLVQILKTINPSTAAAYGPPLDKWSR